MANKGETKILKTNNAYAVSNLTKTKRYLFKSTSGKHNTKTSVSIGYVLRDLLHFVDNKRELIYVVKNRDVFIDQKPVKSYKAPVGFFDIISIPKAKKYYKMMFLRNGSLFPFEIDKEEVNQKICKIKFKKITKNNQVQLTTNDGRTIITTNKAYKPKASIKLDLNENTIKEYYPLEKEREVFVIGGRHVGQKGKIESITPSKMNKNTLIEIKGENENFETVEKNVFVIN